MFLQNICSKRRGVLLVKTLLRFFVLSHLYTENNEDLPVLTKAQEQQGAMK